MKTDSNNLIIENNLDKKLIRILHPNGLNITVGPHTLVSYNDQTLASVNVIHSTSTTLNLIVSVDKSYLDTKLVKASLLFCMLSYLQRQNNSEAIKTVTLENSDILADIAPFFHFRKNQNTLELDFSTVFSKALCNSFKKIKEDLSLKTSPYFITDDLLNDEEAKAMQTEYNAVAWGHTNWAQNTTVQTDELNFIKDKLRGGANLEIGVGSGRVTEVLLTASDSLTGIDREQAVIESLSLKMQQPNLKLQRDDFTQTQLSEKSFDHVVFLENGLGAMLASDDRRRIFTNAHKTLKDGGRFIIGVRSFGDQSKNQVMPTTQDPTIYGAYRTFSSDEIESLSRGLFQIADKTLGGSRPAGGQQLLYELEKIANAGHLSTNEQRSSKQPEL